MWFQEFPGEKKPIFFPCGAFLSCVVDEIFIDVPWFRENSPALKNFWLRAWPVFKTSSTRLQRNNFSSSKTSWRRLEDVLEDVKLLRWRRVEDVFKTCLQDVFKTCLQDVFSVTIFRLPRRLQDILEDEKLLRWRRVEDVLKTSSRPANVCWVSAPHVKVNIRETEYDKNIEIF